MVNTLSLHRQVNHAVLEVDHFRSAGRSVTAEWQRRLEDQARLTQALKALRKEAKRHFGQRNAGEHFEEWLGHNFDVQIARLVHASADSERF